jgi:two-component system, OmpR family, alkaline phosphatase synthesis response regulator PhoP
VTTPHHLLVIDDEPFIGRIVRLEFEEHAYEVSIAHDGDAGLAFLRSHPDVDLVLLDVNMPGKSGLDVLAEVRDDPRLRALPIIVLTAAGQRTYAQRAAELGARAFLTKPFSPRKLVRRVAAMLGEAPDAGDAADGGEED